MNLAIKKFSFKELIYLEIEQYLYFPVKYIPGSLGFFLRFLFVKCFSKSLAGMIWIQPGVELIHTNKIEFGRNVGINTGTYINGVGTIKFGDFALIGNNVTISSGKHPIGPSSKHIYEMPSERIPIVLGSGCWLAAGSVILPGVTIGEGSVVGANSVIGKDIPAYEVYAGAPAVKIKSRKFG